MFVMSDLSGKVSGRAHDHQMKTSLTAVMRKAAYPLPLGDCDESLIKLQYFAGAGKNGPPISFTIKMTPRVVEDIKKQPTGRGPMVRMKRDKQGSSQALVGQGRMPELPSTGRPRAVDTSRHQVRFQPLLYTRDLH